MKQKLMTKVEIAKSWIDKGFQQNCILCCPDCRDNLEEAWHGHLGCMNPMCKNEDVYEDKPDKEGYYKINFTSFKDIDDLEK